MPGPTTNPDERYLLHPAIEDRSAGYDFVTKDRVVNVSADKFQLDGVAAFGHATSTAVNTALPNMGTSVLNTTTAVTHHLDAPVEKGTYKYIFDLSTAATTVIQKVYSGSTAVTFDGTNTVISFAGGKSESVHLIAHSTLRWLLMNNTVAAALGTTT